MKLAVIDHIGNPGGGSRIIRALLPAFRKIRPDIEITFIGNPISIKRENLEDDFSHWGIKYRKLKSVVFTSGGLFGIKHTPYVISRIQERFRRSLSFFPLCISGDVHKELEAIVKDFDMAFFTWPFLMNCPKLKCPMAGIFHDLNFKYYFMGSYGFNPWRRETLEHEMPVWLQRSTPIVSSHFMASELKRFYPEYASKVKVVHLAPNSIITNVTIENAKRIVSDLGITKPYILCPTNLSVHKNLGPLFAAVQMLRKKGHDVLLVLTGPDVEIISGRTCEIGVELDAQGGDVRGLGYVTNLQMDALIQCASVVVNTSLYEAGNGSGVDAWARGVPVAMSAIPPFLEHIDVHGVKAEVFDPRNPQDIADKIHKVLSNPERAKKDALQSKQLLSTITWEHTAAQYLSIFEELIKGASDVHDSHL